MIKDLIDELYQVLKNHRDTYGISWVESVAVFHALAAWAMNTGERTVPVEINVLSIKLRWVVKSYVNIRGCSWCEACGVAHLIADELSAMARNTEFKRDVNAADGN